MRRWTKRGTVDKERVDHAEISTDGDRRTIERVSSQVLARVKNERVHTHCAFSLHVTVAARRDGEWGGGAGEGQRALCWISGVLLSKTFECIIAHTLSHTMLRTCSNSLFAQIKIGETSEPLK